MESQKRITVDTNIINIHSIYVKLKKARSIREMTVYKGEQVICLKEVSEKWIECESKGRTGIVPKSYLEYTDNAFRVRKFHNVRVALSVNFFKVIQYGKATAKYDFKKKSNRQLSFNQVHSQDTTMLVARIGDEMLW